MIFMGWFGTCANLCWKMCFFHFQIKLKRTTCPAQLIGCVIWIYLSCCCCFQKRKAFHQVVFADSKKHTAFLESQWLIELSLTHTHTKTHKQFYTIFIIRWFISHPKKTHVIKHSYFHICLIKIPAIHLLMLQQLLTFHNPTFNIMANSVASARPAWSWWSTHLVTHEIQVTAGTPPIV